MFAQKKAAISALLLPGPRTTKQIGLVILQVLAIGIQAEAIPVARTVDDELLGIYANFCSRNDEKAKLLIDLGIQRDSKKIGFQITNLFFHDRKAKLIERFEKTKNADSTLSDTDRVLAAETLLSIYHSDLERIRLLIAFKTQDPQIETYRLAVEARLDLLNDQTSLGLEKLVRALSLLPKYDPQLAALFLSEASHTDIRENQRQLITHILSTLPKDFPLLPYVEANSLIATSKWKEETKIFSLFKKAYDTCPRDPATAIAYSYILFGYETLPLAKKIITEIFESEPTPNPYVDFIMGKIYFREKNFEQTSLHLERLKNSLVYLNKEDRAEYKKMDDQVTSSIKSNLTTKWISLILASISGAAAAGWYIVRRQKNLSQLSKD